MSFGHRFPGVFIYGLSSIKVVCIFCSLQPLTMWPQLILKHSHSIVINCSWIFIHDCFNSKYLNLSHFLFWILLSNKPLFLSVSAFSTSRTKCRALYKPPLTFFSVPFSIWRHTIPAILPQPQSMNTLISPSPSFSKVHSRRNYYQLFIHLFEWKSIFKSTSYVLFYVFGSYWSFCFLCLHSLLWKVLWNTARDVLYWM